MAAAFQSEDHQTMRRASVFRYGYPYRLRKIGIRERGFRSREDP